MAPRGANQLRCSLTSGHWGKWSAISNCLERQSGFGRTGATPLAVVDGSKHCMHRGVKSETLYIRIVDVRTARP